MSLMQAQRRANGYLAREVAPFATAGEPMLVRDEQPRWRIPVMLRLCGYGNLAEVGLLEVDARTRRQAAYRNENRDHQVLVGARQRPFPG